MRTCLLQVKSVALLHVQQTKHGSKLSQLKNEHDLIMCLYTSLFFFFFCTYAHILPQTEVSTWHNMEVCSYIMFILEMG